MFIYTEIDCNFEDSSCGYSVLTGNSWTRTSNASIDPGHDHTCSTISASSSSSKKCGTWLSSIPSSNYSGTQEFTVLTPYIYSTSQPGCLKFWYHFFGLEKAQFDVRVNYQATLFNAQVLWEKITPQSNNWVQGYVDVPKQSHTYIYIIFHAILTSKYHDTVGIDDITYTPGACPPSPLVDFESGLGSWKSQGATLTNGTPINDHTSNTNLGHYLLTKGGNQQSLITASLKNLTSIYTSSYYSYCFKMWYNFLFQANSGDSDSYIFLNVTGYRYKYSRRLSIQDAYGDGLLNKWEPLSLSIPNYKRYVRYQVANQEPQMSITLYSKGSTQIAIDDLLVSDQACEDPGDCDFERDFCSWQNTGKFLWLRSTGGNTKTLKRSPDRDTTTHTANGWFAIFPLEFIKSYTYAILQSPPLSGRYSYNCLSFNYWAVISSSFASTKVSAFYVTFYDLTKQNKRIAQVAVNASTYPMWQRFHYSLPKLPIKYSISIATAYSSGRIISDLAIDDIVLSDTSCRSDRPVTTPTTPIPYKERVWDCGFEYQCSKWKWDSNWKMTSYKKRKL